VRGTNARQNPLYGAEENRAAGWNGKGSIFNGQLSIVNSQYENE